MSSPCCEADSSLAQHSGVHRSVLVVDDEDAFRGRLTRALAERGFDAVSAADGESALNLAARDTPECAVVDLRMPGLSGLEVVRGLLALDPTTRIVMLTGFGSIATALEAVRSGAVHYLTKPADIDEIVAAFDRGLAPTTLPRIQHVPTLGRVEWEHIDRVLCHCAGNVTQAAALLGLHRRSLQRKLAKRPPAR